MWDISDEVTRSYNRFLLVIKDRISIYGFIVGGI
jgi:hypothetical protein